MLSGGGVWGQEAHHNRPSALRQKLVTNSITVDIKTHPRFSGALPRGIIFKTSSAQETWLAWLIVFSESDKLLVFARTASLGTESGGINGET